MCTKTLLFALLCLLLVTVNSKTMFSGRGFETTMRSRAFPQDKTSHSEDSRSIAKNNGDVIKFLKWKSKFIDCLQKQN